MPLPQIDDDPRSVDELRAGLRRIHEESIAYWSGYDDAAFFAPMGEHWSAADHVRHLTRSMRAATTGFRMPVFALRLFFGRPRGESRRFQALREAYHAVLAAGGRAGRFAPAPLAPDERTAGQRARVMAFHAEAVSALERALGAWRDPALDTARIPHPLLGSLTAREMAQFLLYHNLHHVHVAERRRLEASGG
jgi:hypothetical protein